MAKAICVLYDDPVDGYPRSYPRDDLPKIDHYPGGQSLPTPKAIDFKPGALLGSVTGELGLRKYLESNGHTFIVTSDKDGPNSVLERELPDAEIVISQPFWPAYLTKERIAKAKKLKLERRIVSSNRFGDSFGIGFVIRFREEVICDAEALLPGSSQARCRFCRSRPFPAGRRAAFRRVAVVCRQLDDGLSDARQFGSQAGRRAPPRQARSAPRFSSLSLGGKERHHHAGIGGRARSPLRHAGRSRLALALAHPQRLSL